MNLADKYNIDLTKEHKTGCPRCMRKGNDKSKNNLHVYAHNNSCHCYACGWTIASPEHRAAMGWDDVYEYDDEECMSKEIITEEEFEQIKGYTGTKGKGSRGITDETYKAYACRFKYDEETGEVAETFYPYTEDYATSGFKVRKIPKDFYSVGKIGKESELFGQWKWPDTRSKYVLLTAGEVDCMSAYQMLEDYRKGKGSDFEPTPVVSSGIGETASFKQVQLQYNWLNQHSKIIVCYDNDDAGKAAVKKLVDVLPKGKMFVMKLPFKDINECLEAGKSKQFLRAFFDAPAYSPDGIVGSDSLMSKVRAQAEQLKIPLPPFMHRTQKLMAGGVPLKVIVNLASASGTGKSTIIDECTYFWIFNSPHRVGVLTLESDASQYGTKLLSRHVGVKIDLFEDVEEKLTFLDRPDIVQAAEELFKLPDGTPRWHLIEDRDGGLESLKSLIMELIVACDCKVIICDPVTDMLEGLSNEDQAKFCGWMKGMIKSHDVTFVLVNHVRKSGNAQKANSTGAEMHEEDIFGSSSLIKSAACNLLFTRNKEAEDEIEKNTTFMKMSKCRWTGRTGTSGEYYYDGATHTMHDKEDWLIANPVQF